MVPLSAASVIVTTDGSTRLATSAVVPGAREAAAPASLTWVIVLDVPPLTVAGWLSW